MWPDNVDRFCNTRWLESKVFARRLKATILLLYTVLLYLELPVALCIPQLLQTAEVLCIQIQMACDSSC